MRTLTSSNRLVTLALVAGLSLAAQAAPPLTGRAAAVTEASCSTVQLSVSLPLLLGSLPQQISGQFCTPAGVAVPETVQLLLSGGTYNRKYWDLPYQPENFSYQRDMAAHGYATFAIDRLGTGASSKPLSALLLGTAEAATVQQVVTHLRAGHVGSTAFDRVILVGHSMGSGLAVLTAANHHGVDGVVLTGMTHIPNAISVVGGLALKVHPALLDPQLSGYGSDLGYITTRPGTRGELFYDGGSSVPGAVAADEQYAKDQLSAAGLTDILTLGLVGPLTQAIDVPVLLANGSQDSLFCGPPLARDCSSARALRAQEAPYFSPAARFRTYILPGAGHDIALSRKAARYRAAVRGWLGGLGY